MQVHPMNRTRLTAPRQPAIENPPPPPGTLARRLGLTVADIDALEALFLMEIYPASPKNGGIPLADREKAPADVLIRLEGLRLCEHRDIVLPLDKVGRLEDAAPYLIPYRFDPDQPNAIRLTRLSTHGHFAYCDYCNAAFTVDPDTDEISIRPIPTLPQEQGDPGDGAMAHARAIDSQCCDERKRTKQE